MSRVVTLIPGDGIGPDITEATVKVMAAAGVDILRVHNVAAHTGAYRGWAHVEATR